MVFVLKKSESKFVASEWKLRVTNVIRNSCVDQNVNFVGKLTLQLSEVLTNARKEITCQN